MKPLFVILFCTLLINNSYAQNDRASVAFIKAVINTKDKIIYTDSISNYTISEMREALNEPFVLSVKRNRKQYFSRFSKKEMSYINNELSKMRSFTWKDSLLQNSGVVKQDTVNSIFKRYDIFSGWTYFNAHYGHSFYEFSKPIFLRNHTMCIFYSGYSCGSLCGNGKLAVYARKNGGWILKYILYSSIS